jgi:phenylalanyl-tRNA synthetase beta chain
VDLEREVDLIEEVARHLGYDRIPSSMPTIGEPVSGGTTHPLESRSRSFLAHRGFLEAFNYAMIGRDEDDPFVPTGTPAALEIDNPIAEPLTLLRRSLLPGLLRSVDTNLRRGARDVRLFEVGRVFLAREPAGTLPHEPLRAGLAWAGSGDPRHWSRAERVVDLGDAAGIVEALLGALRPAAAFARGSWEVPGLHPGQAMAWKTPAEKLLAWAGVLHPDLRDRMDLPSGVVLAEIDLDAVADLPDGGFRHRAVPRVPAVARDLSLALDASVRYARVREIVADVEPPAPARFEVIDRYEGEQVGSGRSSLTVRVILQPQERTLTDDAVEAYRQALVTALENEPGVELRG